MSKNKYYIPENIVHDKSICSGVLHTYIILINFFDEGGYALCSDEEIVEARHISLRSVNGHLRTLENAGYIKRETEQKTMIKDRKILFTYQEILDTKGEGNDR